MSAVIPFMRPTARTTSWSQQELAEFYRVEAALVRAGIGIASEHGVSDEGEPWFVFCRPDGDAIMHFARIDGAYLIASEVLDRPVRGADFRAMIDQIARLHPHLLPIPAVAAGTKLVVHPAALLAALVAAAALSLSSGEARAGEIGPGLDHAPASRTPETGGAAPDQPARARAAAGPDDRDDGRKQAEAIILSTMIFAAEAMAADHRDASVNVGTLLSDLAGGTAHAAGQGETAWGASGGGDAGLGGASAVQPAVLTAQGSGASPDAAAPAGRIDPAPTLHIDGPADRGGAPGREAEPHAPGAANEIGPTHIAADSGAVGTGGPQVAVSGRAEGAAGSPVPTASDHGPAASASEASPQTLVAVTGQAETGRAAVKELVKEVEDRGSGHGHGARAEILATDGGSAAKDDHRGPGGEEGKQSGPADTDQGSDHGHGPGEQRGPGLRDADAAGHMPGPAAASGEGGRHSAPETDGPSAKAAEHRPDSAEPAPPRATVDPNGNLVFHGDPHPGAPPPSAAHGPDDSAPHHEVGLVGVADHGHAGHGLFIDRH